MMIGQKMNESALDEFITFKYALIKSQHALNQPDATPVTVEHGYDYKSQQMDEFYRALWLTAKVQPRNN